MDRARLDGSGAPLAADRQSVGQLEPPAGRWQRTVAHALRGKTIRRDRRYGNALGLEGGGCCNLAG